MLVNKIADGLDTSPASRAFAEQLPGDRRKPIGLAISASEEKDECFFGQLLDGGLPRVWALMSGSPLSLTSVSVLMVVTPAGATSRLHQLPKESRYALIGSDGAVTR